MNNMRYSREALDQLAKSIGDKPVLDHGKPVGRVVPGSVVVTEKGVFCEVEIKDRLLYGVQFK